MCRLTTTAAAAEEARIFVSDRKTDNSFGPFGFRQRALIN